MPDILINMIGSAEDVVHATVRHSMHVKLHDGDFLRLETTLGKVFKGNLHPNGKIAIDIPVTGKETPELAVDSGYVFFLKRISGPLEEKGRRLLDLTGPLSVPDAKRGTYFTYIEEASKIAGEKISEEILKAFLFKELRSGVSYFQNDGTRIATRIETWTSQELNALAAELQTKGTKAFPPGNERDNLVFVVTKYGDEPLVKSVAAIELSNGNADALYFGLSSRTGGSYDKLLWSFVTVQDVAVQSEALRVIGLLRRVDMLDSFEKELTPGTDPRIRSALANARKLAQRD